MSSDSTTKPDFRHGDLILGWKIIRKLGSGGCGAVFEVKKDEQRGAMKTEFSGNRETLAIEVSTLRLLQNSPYFCELFASARVADGKKGLNIMVMTVLGRSLSNMRRITPKCQFTPSSAMRIAFQTIEAIEHLHSVGIIHRDVKSSNFAWNDEERHVCMLDLGFCRRYLVIDEETGEAILRQPRKKGHFIGTSKYCSLNAHNREELSRRDDLWCWIYMIVELYTGYLQWRDDSTDAAALRKLRMGFSLVKDCPPELKFIYDYIKPMGFASRPDYHLIKRAICSFLKRKDISMDDTYDWEEGGVFYKEFCKANEKNKKKMEEELELQTDELLSEEFTGIEELSADRSSQMKKSDCLESKTGSDRGSSLPSLDSEVSSSST